LARERRRSARYALHRISSAGIPSFRSISDPSQMKPLLMFDSTYIISHRLRSLARHFEQKFAFHSSTWLIALSHVRLIKRLHSDTALRLQSSDFEILRTSHLPPRPNRLPPTLYFSHVTRPLLSTKPQAIPPSWPTSHRLPSEQSCKPAVNSSRSPNRKLRVRAG